MVKGELVDISPGGACLRVDENNALSPNDIVDIELESGNDSGTNNVVKGVVLRSKKPAGWESGSIIAAKFLDIDEETAKEIKSLYKDQFVSPPILLPADFEEPIRGLRSDIQFSNKTQRSSFLITSSVPKEGKSTITANLGLSLAGINKTTVLIDANLRKPGLHKIFGLSNKTGLSTFLSEGKGFR